MSLSLRWPIASLASVLSNFCFTEVAADLPTADFFQGLESLLSLCPADINIDSEWSHSISHWALHPILMPSPWNRYRCDRHVLLSLSLSCFFSSSPLPSFSRSFVRETSIRRAHLRFVKNHDVMKKARSRWALPAAVLGWAGRFLTSWGNCEVISSRYGKLDINFIDATNQKIRLTPK